MAKNATAPVQATGRSASINLDESQGRSALAAWKMLVNLYGAQVESWNVTANGVEATNFSVFENFDPNTIIADISSRTRRLGLLETLPYLNGHAPIPYANADEITADTVQFYKGAVEEGSAKAPAYVKGAVAAFKAANSLTIKRGPKPKTIHLDKLDELDEGMLSNMDPADIAFLQAALTRVASSKAATTEAATA